MCSTHSPRARQFLRSDAEFGSHSGWLMGMHVWASCAPPPLSLPPPWITKFSVVEHMQRAYKIESSAHATAHRNDTSQQMNNRSRTEEEKKNYEMDANVIVVVWFTHDHTCSISLMCIAGWIISCCFIHTSFASTSLPLQFTQSTFAERERKIPNFFFSLWHLNS